MNKMIHANDLGDISNSTHTQHTCKTRRKIPDAPWGDSPVTSTKSIAGPCEVPVLRFCSEQSRKVTDCPVTVDTPGQASWGVLTGVGSALFLSTAHL